MDPILNCILSACCPEGSEQQLTALATFMAKQGGWTPEDCKPYAALILQHFDLAEKGTLSAFKKSIARLATGPKYQG